MQIFLISFYGYFSDKNAISDKNKRDFDSKGCPPSVSHVSQEKKVHTQCILRDSERKGKSRTRNMYSTKYNLVISMKYNELSYFCAAFILNNSTMIRLKMS